MDVLSRDLQPRLDRLASTEPQHAQPARAIAGHSFVTPEATKAQVAAALRLQAAWRLQRGVLRPHPLANVRFCPENIRRSFVLGVHCPVAPPASTPAAELLAQPFVPPPAARAAAAVPSGGKHFMSIL